jgi:molybdopterin-guanine dinucleotide biosynthesis protein A
MPTPSIAGLVLSGGYSKRMQRDKATLLVDRETQLERAVRLLRTVCDEVYVSVRADQQTDPLRAAYPQIVDEIHDAGPVAGILAALAKKPDHAWLIVAVDLPLLDAATLANLVKRRDPSQLATAYISSHDSLPEPLCAIWEPRCHEPLSEFVAGGRLCPRKFLLNYPARLINLESTDALANVNTPDEYASTVTADRRGISA